MRRNYLSAVLGDAVNALLAGAAFNLRMRLRQIKASFWLVYRKIGAWRSLERTIFSQICFLWRLFLDKVLLAKPKSLMKPCF